MHTRSGALDERRTPSKARRLGATVLLVTHHCFAPQALRALKR